MFLTLLIYWQLGRSQRVIRAIPPDHKGALGQPYMKKGWGILVLSVHLRNGAFIIPLPNASESELAEYRQIIPAWS